MISTQKSRNKLLLPELFFFLTISQLLQEEKFRHKNRRTQKTQKLILLFFPFSTVFPPLKHKLNTNWTQTKYKFNIKKKKKRHRIHRAYWITEERGPWGCGWMTLSRLMRWREREGQSVEEEKQRKKLFKESWNVWQLPNNWTFIRSNRNLRFNKWKRWLTCFVKKMRKINLFLIIENVVYIYLITTHKPGHTNIRNYFFWNKIS